MVFKFSPKQGFTLIEVLIALVVLSAIGITLLQTSETGTGHSHYLEQKLMASWVAENRASELRIANRLGQPLLFNEQVIEQGRGRFVSQVIPVKQTEWLSRLEVQVFDDLENHSKESAPIYRLTLYLPKIEGNDAF